MTNRQTQYWEILPESALGKSRIIMELNHWLVTSREWVNRTLYGSILGKHIKSNGTYWSNLHSKYLYLICSVYQIGHKVSGFNQEFCFTLNGIWWEKLVQWIKSCCRVSWKWHHDDSMIPFALRQAESVLEESLALRSPVPVFTGRVGSRSYPAPASGEHRAGEPAEATRELF